MAVFVSIYVLLARRVTMSVGLAFSLGGWFAVASFEQHWGPPPMSLLAFAIVALLVATLLTRHPQSGRALLIGGKRWYDLPLRALLVGLFAAIVVTVSQAIGPAWTGFFAAFPLALTTSIVLTPVERSLFLFPVDGVVLEVKVVVGQPGGIARVRPAYQCRASAARSSIFTPARPDPRTHSRSFSIAALRV